MRKLNICYHGNCFDGATSAAIFARFYRDRIDSTAEVVFRGMAHRRGDPYGEDHDALFDGDDNAVVDFRYSPSPRLTWWCDHHQSAFIAPEHQAHFESHPSSQKCFDASAPSCAGLLGRWLAQEHGFDAAPFADHLHWADIIDSARFDSPEQAVMLAEPALQLMALLEAAPEPALTDTLIRALSETTIDEARRLPAIDQAVAPVLAQQRATLEVFRRRVELREGVASFDLTADGIEGFNKFIPYYLHPQARYTVGLTLSPSRAKVSVGSNPWQRPEPLTNLAELCRRYGGGGHAVVAAISLPPEAIDEARAAAETIAATLRTC